MEQACHRIAGRVCRRHGAARLRSGTLARWGWLPVVKPAGDARYARRRRGGRQRIPAGRHNQHRRGKLPPARLPRGGARPRDRRQPDRRRDDAAGRPAGAPGDSRAWRNRACLADRHRRLELPSVPVPSGRHRLAPGPRARPARLQLRAAQVHRLRGCLDPHRPAGTEGTRPARNRRDKQAGQAGRAPQARQARQAPQARRAGPARRAGQR